MVIEYIAICLSFAILSMIRVHLPVVVGLSEPLNKVIISSFFHILFVTILFPVMLLPFIFAFEKAKDRYYKKYKSLIEENK